MVEASNLSCYLLMAMKNLEERTCLQLLEVYEIFLNLTNCLPGWSVSLQDRVKRTERGGKINRCIL